MHLHFEMPTRGVVQPPAQGEEFNMKERHKWKLWTQVLLDINHACQIMSY